MSGDKNPAGLWTSADVEVPGSPEQVWQAIATDAGSAAWLFATEIQPHEGGAMVIRREPFGSDVVATVTAWDPPHRFAYEEPIAPGSAAPPLATEFLVEARGASTCIVRVVSGLRDHSEGWEDLVEGAGEGWRMALIQLRSYLTHFAGQSVANLDVICGTGRPLGHRDEVLASLVRMLDLTDRRAGDPFQTPNDAPSLAGLVEHITDSYVLLRASSPCPALVAMSTLPMDGRTLTVNVTGRLYGPEAPAIAGREQPRWAAWLSDRFAAPAGLTR
jgi:uncharacterized protein YndB with AHSA1/START domain